MEDIVVRGTCDGTGAKINVCLGFIPKRVTVWNVDSTSFEKLEWTKENGLVASYADEGRLTKTTSGANATTKLAVASSAQQGIREYAGGDELIYDTSQTRWEYGASSADASEVFVDGTYMRTAASGAAYRCYGAAVIPGTPRDNMKVKTAAGFSIGANGDINANGEQLFWEAVR